VLPDAPLAIDANIGIGDPMATVVDPNLQIESYRHQLWSVTECPRLNFVLKILCLKGNLKINVLGITIMMFFLLF
jgi:hypothetical protein